MGGDYGGRWVEIGSDTQWLGMCVKDLDFHLGISRETLETVLTLEPGNSCVPGK